MIESACVWIFRDNYLKANLDYCFHDPFIIPLERYANMLFTKYHWRVWEYINRVLLQFTYIRKPPLNCKSWAVFPQLIFRWNVFTRYSNNFIMRHNRNYVMQFSTHIFICEIRSPDSDSLESRTTLFSNRQQEIQETLASTLIKRRCKLHSERRWHIFTRK